MTALDMGSDLSGSLRQPAHTTGVFTLKPSFGVVPGRGHIPGPPGTLSSTDMAVLGPIGIQVIAPYLEDRTAIDVVRHIERHLGGFVAPPIVS
jgi:Asp-tRNA(Asn)/Glu-tRNA(Gln) amidotransferase A subunit family amidase